MRFRSVVPLAVWFVVAVGARIRSAEACSPLPPIEFVLDPTHADDTSPPTLTVGDYTVTHYEEGSTCGDGGLIHLVVGPADDRTALADFGYELRGLAGDVSRVQVPSEVRGTYTPGDLIIFFGRDGDLDVTVGITAVDENGNRSAQAQVRLVADEPGGCTVAGARSSSPAAALVIGLAALLAIRCRGGRGRRGVLPRRA